MKQSQTCLNTDDVAGIIDPYESMAPPLYQTATFKQPSSTENGPFDYTRSGNPTRALLETQMAELEGADRALAFSSGMSALAAVCRLVKHGAHQRIIVTISAERLLRSPRFFFVLVIKKHSYRAMCDIN